MIAQCHSAEMFRDTGVLAGGPVTDFLTPGEQFSITVPPEAEMRYLWIACGAHYQALGGDRWLMQGRLTFFLQTTQVGFLEFSDASGTMTDAERLIAPRSILRISASANGSTQPSLRYQSNENAGAKRDNLDIPCIVARVRCDQIVYSLDKSYYAVGGYFLTGLRCVSTPP